MTFAGLPEAMQWAGMFEVTTLLDEITVPSPIVTPFIIFTFEQIHTWSPIMTGAESL